MIILKKDHQFQVVLLSGIILSTLIILLFQFIPVRKVVEVQGLDVKMFLAQTDERKSAFEFKAVDENYELFDKSRLSSKYKFAYLWIELENTDNTDKNIIILNKTRNYYTEMLKLERLGAVTLYRYGDIVPMSESPFKHDKAAFPVALPAGGKLSLIIEYHGPVGLEIDPEITIASDLLDRFATERNHGGLICGAFIVLLIINLINIVMLSWRIFYPVVFFIASVFFFYLRQSRILLYLIDPMIYPEWLFPLSIAFNVVAAVVFILTLFDEYFKLRHRLVLQMTVAIALGLVLLGITGYPYIAADLLNLLPLILIPFGVIGLRGAIIKREWEILYIALSFIPWVVMALIDICSSMMDVRLRSAESMQALGMMATMFFLSISHQILHSSQHKRQINSMSGELDLAQDELTRQMVSVTEFRESVLHQLGYQLRQPLDSVLALSSILANEYALPGVAAVCRLMSSETESLKRIIDNEIDNSMNDNAGDDEVISKALIPRPWIDSSICIFDSAPVHASRTAMILRASGYEVRIVVDQYQALSMINSGKVDVLLIDPTTTGEASFSLCGLVRSDFNMFEIPILMITDYHADYLMKKGYGAGVNDFLTTPFDSSELAARIQSLIKLKKIAKNNHDLAKSEKEKNTFLYFLTHNINTPLTLLLNRINELSNLNSDGELADITDDLQASAREINDIVQNVLISFRLSDGRHTVRLDEVDLKAVIRTVEADLRGTAVEKKQLLTIVIGGEIPPVTADSTALRGILYNLVDNGLKFSPEGSTVNVMVSIEDSVYIRVVDSGPGIPDFEQGRLFERFQKLSPQPTAGESSTGLGLYVAYELARMNGGDLYYENGHSGACFVFTLPLIKDCNQGE